MGHIVKEAGGDISQKALMKAVECSSKKYAEITGKPITKEQKEFLIEVVGSLSDAVITSVRTGKMKPMDVAQLVVSRALSVTGLIKEGSTTSRYMDCGL